MALLDGGAGAGKASKPSPEAAAEKAANEQLAQLGASDLRGAVDALRAGAAALDQRLRKARRDLEHARHRQREVRAEADEAEAAVVQIFQRLSASYAGVLPQESEWREQCQEQTRRKVELEKLIAEGKAAYEAEASVLRRQIEECKRPGTANRRFADEAMVLRGAVDEQCMRLQVVHDYLRGRLDEMDDEALRALLAGPGEADGDVGQGGPPTEEERREMEANLSVTLQRLEEKHQEDAQNLLEFFDSTLSHKGAMCRAVADGTLQKGLQEVPECKRFEQHALLKVLEEVEAICAERAARLAPPVPVAAAAAPLPG